MLGKLNFSENDINLDQKNKVGCDSKSSHTGTAQIVIEEQSSSSNIDSGLCSSSEVTSLEAGDITVNGSSYKYEIPQTLAVPFLEDVSHTLQKSDYSVVEAATPTSNQEHSMTSTYPTDIETPTVSNSFFHGQEISDSYSFFPSEERKESISLPVSSESNRSNIETAGSSKSSGCRRPSSLLLSNSQSTDSYKSLQKQPSGSTKRPSSLFGMPCSTIEPSVKSTNMNKCESVVPAETDSQPTITNPIVEVPVVINQSRLSPSSVSVGSEVLQLPIPTAASSSSISPDSTSLSRSSLLDGSPVQPQEEDTGTKESSEEQCLEAIETETDILIDQSLDATSSMENDPAEQRRTVLLAWDNLGREPPPWVPDSDAPQCSGCNIKFTFTKRRHHCRACGKVFCNSCCSLRFFLEFLNAVARVCITCYPELIRLEARRNNNEGNYPGPPIAAPSALRSQTISQDGDSQLPRREKKNVVFSDGIRPGDTVQCSGQEQHIDDEFSAVNSPMEIVEQQHELQEQAEFIAHYGWEKEEAKSLFYDKGLEELSLKGSVKLALNSRLMIEICRADLSNCCSSSTSQVPTFAIMSIGLCSATDHEFSVIFRTESIHAYIECIVNFYLRVWNESEQGRIFEEFSCVNIEPLLFLLFRPTFQCTQHLPLPLHSKWLCAIIITDQAEQAWARLFPLRLLLRLGHEFSHYPTPLVTNLSRPPLFHNPGHTVLSLFSDFRSFRYRLELITGAVLHLDRAPCGSHHEIPSVEIPNSQDIRTHKLILPVTAANQIKLLSLAANDHVLAIGTSFSPSADGHLVAVQAPSPDATYRTEAITMMSGSSSNSSMERIRVVAGSFIIFNGSLRATDGKAKLTILEDGAMLQIAPDQMVALKAALSKTENFTLSCVTTNTNEGETDTLHVEWADNQTDIETLGPWSRPLPVVRCRLPMGYLFYCKSMNFLLIFFFLVSTSP